MKLRPHWAGLIIALLPFTNSLAQSQEGEIADLRRQLEEQDQRTRILERKLEIQDENAKAAAPNTPVVKAGAKGFSISTPDNAFVLKLRGLIQADGRYFFDDPEPYGGKDEWSLTRVRPILEGTLAGIYDFRFTPDFGQGRTVIQDAWISARFLPEFQFTAGKFKMPVGLERLQSASDIRFQNRAFPTALAPNRDIGLQANGILFTDAVTYQLAWVNGANDGGSSQSFNDADVNDGKDLALRVFATPFVNAENAWWRGLGIGLAGTYADQKGTLSQTLLPTFASPAGLTFFAYRGNAPASGAALATNATIADGKRYRYSPQAYWYGGSFGFLAEYINVSQDVSRRPTATDPIREETLDNNAWQVQLSWAITGEEESFKSILPASPFTIGGPGWGAFELVARYSALSVDDAAFTGGAASFANPDVSASDAHNIGAAVNWYLNQNLKVIVDYEFTRFDGGAPNGGDREDEKALLARFQVAF